MKSPYHIFLLLHQGSNRLHSSAVDSSQTQLTQLHQSTSSHNLCWLPSLTCSCVNIRPCYMAIMHDVQIVISILFQLPYIRHFWFLKYYVTCRFSTLTRWVLVSVNSLVGLRVKGLNHNKEAPQNSIYSKDQDPSHIFRQYNGLYLDSYNCFPPSSGQSCLYNGKSSALSNVCSIPR